MRTTHILLFAAALLVPACARTPPPAPATKVVFQDVIKEVKKPCPVEQPKQPDKLARPLPASPAQLIDLLTAKLTEWAGDGGYGDQASAAIATCLKP